MDTDLHVRDTELPRHTLRHGDGRRLHVYGTVHGALPEDGVRGELPLLHQRLDALTGARIAVSPARNTRPLSRAAPADAPACPLCPGGPEVPFDYDAAVFENRFPSLVAHPPEPPPVVDDVAEVTAPATGRCEVVLYTSTHTGSLATLTPPELARVIAVWTDRSRELWADPALEAVLIFENRGEAVGATLSHPHGQIYAFDHLPPQMALRVERLAAHRSAEGGCLSCRVVAADDASERVVAANGTFVVAVPFAPRWPFEVHVRARRHGAGRLGDLSADEQRDLAGALRDVVLRYDALYGFELPYMMVAREAPAGAPDWHLAFEFLPPHRGRDKLKVRASVETAAGYFIVDVLPETSAAALREPTVPPTRWEGVDVPEVVVAVR